MAQRRKLRVFLDANVIFSGLYSETGVPERIVDNITVGTFTAVVSRDVLDEVERNLATKSPESLASLDSLLNRAALEIVQDPSPEEVARWMPYLRLGDASILAAAVAAQPDYFVTGDRHFLDNPTLARESGLRIVTPAQLMELADVP